MRDYDNSEIAAVIDEVIHSERDRAILKRRYIDGICQEPLAEEFGLSAKHIQRILYKNQDKVFRRLENVLKMR
jgi:DNA-directed RNA polymerase specialized sigma subunit